jgi:1,4-dihydroxy-2-naphthoate octaprenyltransferase
MSDILALLLAAILPVLIVLKNDKQVVHLLEGKLFRRGQDTSAARETYSRYKEPISPTMFVIGMWIAFLGLAVLGIGAAGILVAVLGGVCALIGIIGRMRSFRAADKELG